MSPYATLSFAIGILWVYLGARTLTYNYRDDVNRLFALVCLSMVIWSVSNGVVFSLKNVSDIPPFVVIAYVGAYFFFPLQAHFFVVLGKWRLPVPFLAALYLPAGVLNVANVAGHSIYERFEPQPGDWKAIFDFQTVWIYIYAASIVLCYLFMLAAIGMWMKNTAFRRERRCARLLLALATITMLGALVFTIVLPFFGEYGLEIVGLTLFHVYGIGLFLLINRYRFLNWHKGLTANQIIPGLSGLAVLIDRERKVLESNDRFPRELRLEPAVVNGSLFDDFIQGKTDFPRVLNELAARGEGSSDLTLTLKKGTEEQAAQVRVTAVRDRFGDTVGFFLLINPIRNLDGFRKDFRITHRELEIIGLLVAGVPYKGVSARLSISLKTVEAHVTNIYNKLAINNKIELIRLTRDLDLAPPP